jgi:predicted secreted protein
MAYQNRLDQLESEVFQTAKPASIKLTSFTPYFIICAAALVVLYITSPSFIKSTPPKTKTNRNPVAQVQLQRLLLAWIILCLMVCLMYYKYSDKISTVIGLA